jgi:hypothetical protein
MHVARKRIDIESKRLKNSLRKGFASRLFELIGNVFCSDGITAVYVSSTMEFGGAKRFGNCSCPFQLGVASKRNQQKTGE